MILAQSEQGLQVDFYRQSHGFWFERQIALLLNVIYWSLLTYYLLYECLTMLFKYLGYPQLPILSMLNNGSWLDTVLTPVCKPIVWLGALFGLIGSANTRLSLVIVCIIISLPFILLDTYRYWMDNHHMIDPDEFLLYQTLFHTTVRGARLLATLANFVVLFHLSAELPDGLGVSDFL